MAVPVLGAGGASGDPGTPGIQKAAYTAASSDPGNGNGASSGSSAGSSAPQSGSSQSAGGGRGGGSGGSGGSGGGTSNSGGSGSSSGAPAGTPSFTPTGSSTGGGGGNPTGGDSGRSGSGSNPGDSGSSGQSGTPAGTPQSQGNGQPGRSGSGSGSGSSAGSGNKCTSACHVAQQTGPAGTATFTPLPSMSVAPAVSSPTQATTIPTRTLPSTPAHVVTVATQHASTPKSGSAKHAPASKGSGTTAARSRTAAAAAAAGTATSGAFEQLLGGTPAVSTTTKPTSPARQSTRAEVKVITKTDRTFVTKLEHVIPLPIWIALGGLLAFAAAAGGMALRSGHRARRTAGQFAAMSEAAMTDPLTGILNRRGFIEAVERELARARRYNRPFVLAYVDVRGLKAVNDTEGHRAGDELLKEAAQLLASSTRPADVVGRLGGDEMGLLLAEQGPEGAAAVKRRIAGEVLVRRETMGLESHWDLTIGTAAFPEDGETVDELLRLADERLYEQRGIEIR